MEERDRENDNGWCKNRVSGAESRRRFAVGAHRDSARWEGGVDGIRGRAPWRKTRKGKCVRSIPHNICNECNCVRGEQSVIPWGEDDAKKY